MTPARPTWPGSPPRCIHRETYPNSRKSRARKVKVVFVRANLTTPAAGRARDPTKAALQAAMGPSRVIGRRKTWANLITRRSSRAGRGGAGHGRRNDQLLSWGPDRLAAGAGRALAWPEPCPSLPAPASLAPAKDVPGAQCRAEPRRAAQSRASPGGPSTRFASVPFTCAPPRTAVRRESPTGEGAARKKFASSNLSSRLLNYSLTTTARRSAGRGLGRPRSPLTQPA